MKVGQILKNGVLLFTTFFLGTIVFGGIAVAEEVLPSFFDKRVKCEHPVTVSSRGVKKESNRCQLSKNTKYGQKIFAPEYNATQRKISSDQIKTQFRAKAAKNLEDFLLLPSLKHENAWRTEFNKLSSLRKSADRVKILTFQYINAQGYSCKLLKNCIVFHTIEGDDKLILKATVLVLSGGFLGEFIFQETWTGFPTKK